MSTASLYQGGMKKESTYGTPETVNSFFPVVSDTIVPQYATLESKSLRPGFAPHKDAFSRYILGAQGALTFEVSARQYSKWLYQMMGHVDTTSSLVNATYTVHTYTMAELEGVSFTWQGARPTFPSDTANPFTFAGGKVTKWKLSNAAEGLLQLVLDCDFQDWTDGTGLASAVYPTSGDTLFAFQGASVLFDSTSVDVYDVEVEVDNKLKVDRRYLDGNGGLKQEPLTDGSFRVGTWAAMTDFDDMTHVDRLAAATAADGAVTAIEATWGIPGTDIAELKVSIPAARFDDGWPSVGGAESLTSALKGGVMYDGTNSPVTITYTTLTTAGS